MVSFSIIDIKQFMKLLLKSDTFGRFELAGAKITTMTEFQISGTLIKDFYSSEEIETLDRTRCLWSDVQPFVYEIIKGTRQPKQMKIVLCANKKIKERFKDSPDLFLNIIFDMGNAYFTTGASYKNFTLDKSAENIWDEEIQKFFKKSGIAISERNL